MRKHLLLYRLVLNICCMLLAACTTNSASMQSAPTGQVVSGASTLPTRLVTPTVRQEPAISLVPSVTPSKTPSIAIPTSESTSQPRVILHVPPDIAKPVWGGLSFALGPEDNVWIAGLSGLFQFATAGYYPSKTINLEGRVTSIDTFNVTDSGIWLLDNVHNPQQQSKILHLNFSGEVLDEYSIPRKFFTNIDGQYKESGVDRIIWGKEGELMLSGSAGVFLLLDRQGKAVGKRLYAYYFGEHTYRIERINDSSVSLYIDEQTVTITTKLERIFVEVLGFSDDSSIYLRITETSGVAKEFNDTIRQYSSTAELLCMAQIIYDKTAIPVIPVTFSNGGVYAERSNTDGSVDVLQVCPVTD